MVESKGLLDNALPDTPQEEEKEEWKKITLWRSPIRTVSYFGRQLYEELFRLYEYMKEHCIVLLVLSGFLTAVVLFLNVPGPHQQYLVGVNKEIVWCLWWVGLGILSSVGLGCGLHTFLLYLGPHIATVTMSAWECSSVDFPEPPYPDILICPKDAPKVQMSIWIIMNKVRVESFMWGIGTAIGELPPYFMARAMRLAGGKDSLEELPEDAGCWVRLQYWVQRLVQRAGFFGILLCASIPNPIFDLAGVTCGYLLISFTTFFSATLIGKSVIKMHLQMATVICIFTKDNMLLLEDAVSHIPFLGPVVHQPFVDYMEQQRETLHDSTVDDIKHSTTLLSVLFNLLIVLMVMFFVVSIVNSMAQQKFKREHQDRFGHYKPLTECLEST